MNKMTKYIIVHAGSEMTKMMEGVDNNTLILDLSDISFFKRLIRKFTYKAFPKFWIRNTFRLKNEEYVFILFDSPYTNYWILQIKKIYSNSKVFFWFWNSYESEKINKRISKGSDFVASFDKEQCERFSYEFLPQFIPYNIDILRRNCDKTVSKDVFFIGSEKGRIDELVKISKSLDKQCISYDFFLLTQKKTNIKGLPFILIERPMKYIDVIAISSKSKAIVELNKSSQSGLTLRAIESMFLGVKLITNNPKIQEYDFYSEKNIYILGEDRTIKDFLNEPIELINDAIKYRYTFSAWFNEIIRLTSKES